MSKYTCLDIIKTKAKSMVDATLTHAQALESIAKNAKFANYHELVKVAKVTPLEPRLLMAAFGNSDLKDVIYSYYDTYNDGPYADFESAVENDIASTNADGFTVDDLTVTEALYDDTKGLLDLKVNFTYQGEQMPDHAFSGTSFNFDAAVSLLWRDEKWFFVDEDFEITNAESDVDSDWYDVDLFDETNSA